MGVFRMSTRNVTGFVKRPARKDCIRQSTIVMQIFEMVRYDFLNTIIKEKPYIYYSTIIQQVSDLFF